MGTNHTKKVVKAKSEVYFKQLKVSIGEVSERWDPQVKQVVLDWTQSSPDSTWNTRRITLTQPTIPTYSAQANPFVEVDLERAKEDFYRAKAHLDRPPPYSAQANLIELNVQRPTEARYRSISHLDRVPDLESTALETKYQISMGRDTSARKESQRQRVRTG
ncbi:hypothetical protein CEK25_003649 [Fusarium fujikuroi]|nr:hypothetical protein CEK25_003649 [Fusarium fujikuroi]